MSESPHNAVAQCSFIMRLHNASGHCRVPKKMILLVAQNFTHDYWNGFAHVQTSFNQVSWLFSDNGNILFGQLTTGTSALLGVLRRQFNHLVDGFFWRFLLEFRTSSKVQKFCRGLVYSYIIHVGYLKKRSIISLEVWRRCVSGGLTRVMKLVVR